MRFGFLSLALIIMVFACAPGGLESATRTAFAQSQQPRSQSQPPEGLPADKKKALSKFAPEDVFNMSEKENNPGDRGIRGSQRKPTSTLPSTSSPPQRAPATSAPAPPKTSSTATSSTATSSAAPLQSAVETPSPAIGAVASDSGIQPSLGQVDSTDKVIRWPVYGLMALALIVLAALIFTLTKLWEKIRETSVG
jgi:hypothetical protein